MPGLTAGGIKNSVKKGHFIQNRRVEKWLGIILFVVAAFLLYDAYDGRGREAMWPISSVLPW